MKKLLILSVLLLMIFFISCGEEEKSKEKECKCNSWEVCVNNECKLAEGKCNDKNDCSEGQICNDNHTCKTENNNQCTSNKECPSDKPVCENGICKAKENKCIQNSDCPTDKPVCKDGICMEENSSQCIGLSFDDIWVGHYRNELISVFGDYQLVIGFYDADSPVGEYDLSSQNNSNYATCNQCVTISKYSDPNNPPEKTFFQERGILEIKEGDGRTGESIGEIRNIKLTEVTIEDDSYKSTPVEGGECIEMQTATPWSWNTLCEEGTKRCNKDNNTIEVCLADHTWSIETACLENEECTIDIDNGIYCKGNYCNEGDKRCNENGNIEICKEDERGEYFWDIFKNCTNNTICDTDTFTCIPIPCNNGDKTCNADGTAIKTCVNEIWQETLCQDGKICTGNGETTACTLPQTNAEWLKISVKSVQSCGIKETEGKNKLYCWGTGSFGRLGTGNEENKLVPTEVNLEDNNGWTDISVGNQFACGIKNSKIYCWGKNDKGQLGDSTNTNKLSPVEISGENNDFVKIEAGGYHACALKSNNSLYCWGRNDYGEIGNGENTNVNEPVRIDGIWTDISLGDKYTCGIKTVNNINKLFCWGDNLFGKLGIAQDDTTSRNIPTEVYEGNQNLNKDWDKVFCGYDSSCAIKTDKKMYCWGNGNSFKLGTGNTQNLGIPTKINDENWLLASIGYYHACAIKEDNTAYCWGKGDYGRLGTGNEETQTLPTRIEGNNWNYIESGLKHNCGLKTINGKKHLYCWGSGSKGRLGTGNEENQFLPVEIQ